MDHYMLRGIGQFSWAKMFFRDRSFNNFSSLFHMCLLLALHYSFLLLLFLLYLQLEFFHGNCSTPSPHQKYNSPSHMAVIFCLYAGLYYFIISQSVSQCLSQPQQHLFFRIDIKSTYCCVSQVLDLIEPCHLIKHYSSCHTLAVVLTTGKVVGIFWLNSYCTQHLHTCDSDAE